MLMLIIYISLERFSSLLILTWALYVAWTKVILPHCHCGVDANRAYSSHCCEWIHPFLLVVMAAAAVAAVVMMVVVVDRRRNRGVGVVLDVALHVDSIVELTLRMFLLR